MNEVTLSDDLSFFATKINRNKQVIGYSFIEIGKDLIQAKEKEVSHGEWQLFLDEINMSRSQADRHIYVTKKYEAGKLPDVGSIGLSAMYEIATLPEEKRGEAINEDGTAKTIKEIRELKKQNKELEQAKQQAERQAQKARESEQIAVRRLEEMEDREPEIIEKEVVKEVIPDHVKKQIEEKEVALQSSKQELESMKEEIKRLRYQAESSDEEARKEKEVKLLMLDASKSVLNTKIKIDEFLQEVAVTPYRRGAIAASSEGAKKKLTEGMEELKNFIKEMELAIDGTIEH